MHYTISPFFRFINVMTAYFRSPTETALCVASSILESVASFDSISTFQTVDRRRIRRHGEGGTGWKGTKCKRLIGTDNCVCVCRCAASLPPCLILLHRVPTALSLLCLPFTSPRSHFIRRFVSFSSPVVQSALTESAVTSLRAP